MLVVSPPLSPQSCVPWLGDFAHAVLKVLNKYLLDYPSVRITSLGPLSRTSAFSQPPPWCSLLLVTPRQSWRLCPLRSVSWPSPPFRSPSVMLSHVPHNYLCISASMSHSIIVSASSTGLVFSTYSTHLWSEYKVVVGVRQPIVTPYLYWLLAVKTLGNLFNF